MRFFHTVLLAAACVVSSTATNNDMSRSLKEIKAELAVKSNALREPPNVIDDNKFLASDLVEERSWPLLNRWGNNIKWWGKDAKQGIKKASGFVSQGGNAKYKTHQNLHKGKKDVKNWYYRMWWWFKKTLTKQKHKLSEDALHAKHKMSQNSQMLWNRAKEANKMAWHETKEAIQAFKHWIIRFMKTLKNFAKTGRYHPVK